MSDASATNTINKEAADISTQSGSKGLEATGGVEGALAKEREARGASNGESAHAQDGKGDVTAGKDAAN